MSDNTIETTAKIISILLKRLNGEPQFITTEEFEEELTTGDCLPGWKFRADGEGLTVKMWSPNDPELRLEVDSDAR